MHLIPDAWIVIKHAWSVRIIVLCSVMQLLEQPAVDYIQQHWTGYNWWLQEAVAVLVAAIGLLAIYARVKFQQKLQDKLAEAAVQREVSNASQ